LLPDGDSSSGSLWGHGLLDLQDDFGLHQDMSDRADTRCDNVYLQFH
jgi:hypothetical protein